jgi:uncharacterized protein YbaR (Trm112 family)
MTAAPTPAQLALASVGEPPHPMACPACGRGTGRFLDCRPPEDRNGINGTMVCPQCANIFRVCDGRARPMTRDERKELIAHSQADEIKKAQLRFAEQLWG